MSCFVRQYILQPNPFRIQSHGNHGEPNIRRPVWYKKIKYQVVVLNIQENVFIAGDKLAKSSANVKRGKVIIDTISIGVSIVSITLLAKRETADLKF